MTEAATPTPQPTRPPEELHWGIAYLREDFQDLRQEVRGEIQNLRQEIQGVRQEVREEIRTLYTRLDSRFNTLVATMIAIGGLIISLVGVVIVMVKS
jgi:hypothetical protein